MENIKFIKEIMAHGSRKDYIPCGDALYCPMNNGNRAKIYVGGGNIHGESYGVFVIIINAQKGEVDRAYLPFETYFKPVQCSKGSPLWYQHIVHGKWWFSERYKHVLPTAHDYENIAAAAETYIAFMDYLAEND